MFMNHKFSLDMLDPGTPHRMAVKQGDALTHSLEITLFAGGEPWQIPAGVTPMVRWFACDPDTGESARGIFDTLPQGGNAWNYTANQLDLVLVPQMFAMPGLVQTDVALIAEEKVLATFNFEFYVHRAPSDGTEPEIRDYYRVATLEQINDAIAQLQDWQESTDRLLANLEHHVDELTRMVNGM